MYCTQCGIELRSDDRFCSRCGARTGIAPVVYGTRSLMLDKCNRKIAGVCAGFAQYFDVDVTLMRIIWLVLVFVPPGIGLIGYLLAWLVMPKDESRAVTSSEPSAVTR